MPSFSLGGLVASGSNGVLEHTDLFSSERFAGAIMTAASLKQEKSGGGVFVKAFNTSMALVFRALPREKWEAVFRSDSAAALLVDTPRTVTVRHMRGECVGATLSPVEAATLISDELGFTPGLPNEKGHCATVLALGLSLAGSALILEIVASIAAQTFPLLPSDFDPTYGMLLIPKDQPFANKCVSCAFFLNADTQGVGTCVNSASSKEVTGSVLAVDASENPSLQVQASGTCSEWTAVW